MEIDRGKVTQIHNKIQSAKSIVIFSHVRPDGDAIGSLLGFGLCLIDAGKKVQLVLADGVPNNFRFLPGSDLVQKNVENFYDLVIVLDSSDFNRTGLDIDKSDQPDVNIDHHITNNHFARLNLVIPEAVSTTEILSHIIPDLDLIITQVVAENLLTGIITDTIGFRTSNMNPNVLRLAANLMEFGVDISDVYMKALNQKSFEAIKMWGAGLLRLQRDEQIIWTSISLLDRKNAGYPGRDDADLINVMSTIQDSKVNIIFLEQPNGKIKVSWRAVPGHDVTRVASLYRGGGHPAAAGAEVVGDMGKVTLEIIKMTKSMLFNE